jgi:hypothetical protein|tara:strand:- start:4854 stop:5186 length:333 start_codon:yes stop_codon:yes gene_type:complete
LKAASNAMSIDNNGNAILRGTLVQNQDPINPAPDQDEFVMKDSLGDVVALVRLQNGNMFISGNLFESQPSLIPPASDDFVIINSDGEVISYIDESGNFYLRGSLTQNGNP